VKLLFFAFCVLLHLQSPVTKYTEAATDAGFNTSKPMFTNLVQNAMLWQEQLMTVVCLTVWHTAHCTFSGSTHCGLKTVFVFRGMETSI